MDVDSQLVRRFWRFGQERLQWSHVLMDVDSTISTAIIPRMMTLQWSHVLMDVDRSNERDAVIAVLPASMEPRPDGRG